MTLSQRQLIGVVLLLAGSILVIIVSQSAPPLISNFVIEQPQQLDVQIEFALVSGRLKSSNDTSLSEMQIVVYLKGTRPESESQWQRSDPSCTIQAAEQWSFPENCIIFPQNYTEFSLLAVLVMEDEARNLDIIASTEEELRSKLRQYAYPPCDNSAACDSISPVKWVQRELANTPTPVVVTAPSLGETLFYEEFENPERIEQWTQGAGGDTDFYETDINGYLRIAVDGWDDRRHTWKSIAPSNMNCITCSIQVIGHLPEQNSEAGYGIVFGYENVDNYYIFAVDKTFTVQRAMFAKGDSTLVSFLVFVPLEFTEKLSHTIRVDIYPDPDVATDPPSMLASGYVDGKLVANFRLDNYPTNVSSRVGLMAIAGRGQDAAALFDNFQVSELPESFYQQQSMP